MSAPLSLAQIVGAAALVAGGAPEPQNPSPTQNPSFFNPQMAIVGDFAYALRDNFAERRRAAFREIEFGFAADADPFLRVEAYIGLHKEDDETHVEVEEAFGRYSNLGRGLSAKFGKFAAAFGRVQRNHTDQLNYLNYPWPIRDALGDEGLRAGGASLSYLFPGTRFSELTVELLDAGEEGPVFNNSDLNEPAYAAHYRTFFDFSEDLSAQLGFSYLNGPTMVGSVESLGKGAGDSRRGDLYGVDYTMKWQPGARGRSASLEAEALWTKPGGVSKRTFGAFVRGTYEVAPQWHLTAGYDHSEIPGTSDERKAWLLGLTRKVSEFHHWRLEFEEVTSNFEPTRNVLTLQFQWVIGAHPAHRY
jgi:hypothetical protein